MAHEHEREHDGHGHTHGAEIRHVSSHVEGAEDVAEVRARWLGHRLRAEVNVAVNPALSVAEGHAVAREVNHRLMHELKYLDMAVVHVDPARSRARSTTEWTHTAMTVCPLTPTEPKLSRTRRARISVSPTRAGASTPPRFLAATR